MLGKAHEAYDAVFEQTVAANKMRVIYAANGSSPAKALNYAATGNISA